MKTRYSTSLRILWLTTCFFPAIRLKAVETARSAAAPPVVRANTPPPTNSPAGSSHLPSLDSLKIILAPHQGGGEIDREITAWQQRVKQTTEPARELEQLGWLFVAKARLNCDPGFYKLAEHCALAIAANQPQAPAAQLLRGHVLHSLHRFAEAEPLARELASTRGLSYDHGLLGDVLMEQGRLREAVAAYQKMVDTKPDMQAYARIAHVRWLKGDLPGALEAMRLATGAASPKDKESAAWAYARLALYQLQAGDFAAAKRCADTALGFLSDSPAALLARGRILLAEEKAADALAPLQRAVQLNPLPEFQWTLAEALRLTGRAEEAARVEAKLKRHGANNDPRTFALFLATRSEQMPTALRLAQHELTARADVFTHDALAWSLAAAGRWAEAKDSMRKALAEGTQDARLFFHAGVIAAQTGKPVEAKRYLNSARAIQQMLQPSERARLTIELASLSGQFEAKPRTVASASGDAKNLSTPAK